MTSQEFRAWRRKRYRTAVEACVAFGVNNMTIWRWENDRGLPPGRLLELACRGLDLERAETEAAE